MTDPSAVAAVVIGGFTCLGMGAGFAFYMGKFVTADQHSASIQGINKELSLISQSIKEMAEILKEQRAIEVRLESHGDSLLELKNQVLFLQENGCYAHIKDHTKD